MITVPALSTEWLFYVGTWLLLLLLAWFVFIPLFFWISARLGFRDFE